MADEFDVDAFMSELGSDEPPKNTTNHTTTQIDTTTSPGWDEATLADLVEERTFTTEESHADTTNRLLRENAPKAVMALTRLAFSARSENTRLRASTYIIDKVTEGSAASKGHLENLFEELTAVANGVPAKGA